MPFVLTVDQAGSRGSADAVEQALRLLSEVNTRLPFERTAGDEFQALFDNPASVLAAMLMLMRGDQWHIGLGIGTVETPLPDSTRAGRGPAFVAARAAVDGAKRDASHLSVETPDAPTAGRDAEVALRLLAAVRSRRTEQGWQAAELMDRHHNMAAVAAELEITRQAVGQRLAAAHWALEAEARPTLERLLARAEGTGQEMR